MPGPRQPTDLVKANGRKHLSQAEEDERRDREVHVPPPDKAQPPRWLLKLPPKPPPLGGLGPLGPGGGGGGGWCQRRRYQP